MTLDDLEWSLRLYFIVHVKTKQDIDGRIGLEFSSFESLSSRPTFLKCWSWIWSRKLKIVVLKISASVVKQAYEIQDTVRSLFNLLSNKNAFSS